MLKQAVKRILALLLALMFMLISAVSFADNNSGKDSNDNDNEDRNSDYGIAVDSNGHVYPEYFSGIANDMLSKLKELFVSEKAAPYGEGISFNLKAALASDDFEKDCLSGLVIGIDPGHQFKADDALEPIAPDSTKTKERQSAGSRGIRTGVFEHTINLLIADKLAGILRQAGAEVVLTRTDAYVSLSNSERALMMNDANVDFWIRLHCESSQDCDTSGCTILVPAPIDDYIEADNAGEENAASAKQDKAEASNAAADDAVSNTSKEAEIAGTNADSKEAGRDIFIESFVLASTISKAFCSVTGAQSLGIVSLTDQTGFNYSLSPVIAIEMGCLSNPSEDIKLNRASYQDSCAFGIYLGIKEYVKTIDDPESNIKALFASDGSDAGESALSSAGSKSNSLKNEENDKAY